MPSMPPGYMGRTSGGDVQRTGIGSSSANLCERTPLDIGASLVPYDTYGASAAKELQRKDARLDCMTRRLAEKNELLAQMSTDITSFQAQGDPAGFISERLQIKMSGKQEEERRLQAGLAQKLEEVKQARCAVVELKQEHDVDLQRLMELVASSREVSGNHMKWAYNDEQFSTVATKDRQIQNLAMQVGAASVELADRTVQLETLTDTLDAKEVELRHLRGQVINMDAEVGAKQATSSSKDKLRDEVNHLVDEVREKDAKIVSMVQELVAEDGAAKLAEDQLVAERNAVRLAMQRVGDKQKKLHENLRDVQTRFAAKSSELVAMAEHVKCRHKETQAWEDDISGKNSDLYVNLCKMEQSQYGEIAVRSETAARLESYIKNVRVILSQNKTELADKRAELAGSNTDVKRLLGTIEARAMSIENESIRIERFHTELALKKGALLEKCDDARLRHTHMVEVDRAERSFALMQLQQELEQEYVAHIAEMKSELQRMWYALLGTEERLQRSERSSNRELEQLRREFRVATREQASLTEMVECLESELRTKDVSIAKIQQTLGDGAALYRSEHSPQMQASLSLPV